MIASLVYKSTVYFLHDLKDKCIKININLCIVVYIDVICDNNTREGKGARWKQGYCSAIPVNLCKFKLSYIMKASVTSHSSVMLLQDDHRKMAMHTMEAVPSGHSTQ